MLFILMLDVVIVVGRLMEEVYYYGEVRDRVITIVWLPQCVVVRGMRAGVGDACRLHGGGRLCTRRPVPGAPAARAHRPQPE